MMVDVRRSVERRLLSPHSIPLLVVEMALDVLALGAVVHGTGISGSKCSGTDLRWISRLLQKSCSRSYLHVQYGVDISKAFVSAATATTKLWWPVSALERAETRP